MACCIMTAFRMEFSVLLPPEREISGISLSMSVLAVLIFPKYNAFSMNFLIFAMGIMVLLYEHENVINVNFYMPDQFNLRYYNSILLLHQQ